MTEKKRKHILPDTENWSDRRLFLTCLLVALAFMAVYVAVFYPFFETNDDMAAARIVDGSKGSYDPHMIIQHVVLGYILCFLYQLVGSIAWYTVIQYVVILFSMAAIGFCLCRMVGRAGAVAYAFLLLVCTYDTFIIIQYTRTCGMAAAAGTCLLLTAYVRKGKQLPLMTGGCALLFMAFLYRMNMTVICVFLLTPAIFLHFVEDDRSVKEKLSRAGIYVLTVGVLFGGLYGIEKLAYSSDFWQEFRTFDNARIELLDYGLPDYNEKNEQILTEKYNINGNAFTMLYSWCYMDTEVFTAQAMETMVSMKTPTDYINKEKLKTFLQTVPSALLSRHVIVLLLFAVLFYLICSRHRLWDILTALLTAAFLMFVYYYLYCSGRWEMNRIAFPMFVAAALSWMMMCRPAEHAVRIRMGCTTLAGIALILSVFSGTYSGFSLLFRNSNEAKVRSGTSEGLQRFVNSCYEDKEHFYICNVNTILRDGCYEPFDIAPKDVLTNFLTLGGWPCYTRQYVDLMEANGITNPQRAFVDNEDVLLITNLPNLFTEYLTYQLGCEVVFETVPDEEIHICDDLPVYRVYTVKED